MSNNNENDNDTNIASVVITPESEMYGFIGCDNSYNLEGVISYN